MTTAPETIPLFPLGAVLLPHGRMPLQIFEPRYLDLVSHCLKSDTGFGVVWLAQGRDVSVKKSQKPSTTVRPKLSQIGTYAKIVDWDALPNGLLGITIEGDKKFRLLSSQQQANKLHVGEIQWIEREPVLSLPEEAVELQGLLSQLLQHPHVARLKVDANVDDVGHLACLLTQLLPIDERVKFDLLAITDPLYRLEQLMTLLDSLSQ